MLQLTNGVLMGAPLPPKATRLYILSASFFAAIVAVNLYIFSQTFWSKTASKPLGSPTQVSSEIPTDLLPVDKVKGLAAAAVPNVPITKIELRPEGEKFVYDISLADDTVIKLDAQTGVKLSTTTVHTETDKETLGTESPAIDFALARQIAMTQKPTGVVSTIELGTKDSKAIYRVKFADGSLIGVAATNGAIIALEETPKDSSSTTDSTKNNTGTSSTNTTTPSPQPTSPDTPPPSPTPNPSPTTP